MRVFLKIFLFISIYSNVLGQDAWLYPNRGQWVKNVFFKIDLLQGDFFIEEDGFTYSLSNGGKHIEGHESHLEDNNESFMGHVIKTKFLGSSWDGSSYVSDSSSFYNNYILGNNPENWFGHIHGYKTVRLYNYYDGIDMLINGDDGFKYSFIINPFTNVNQIRLDYKGQSNLYLDDDGNLHICNRFGEIIESNLAAWTETELGVKKSVNVQFKLVGDELTFVFPDGYDTSQKLIIDPTLTFSTFTGATSDNWGMTATPDSNGNLFGGGISFGIGYPTTVGAYDASFNGGTASSTGLPGFDISITKFTADGSALIYSTFIGGSSNELPESMICNSNNELYILGVTASSNFPMVGAYDNTFGGGSLEVQNGLTFPASDLFVARLSADGSSLLSSTFMGGSGNDGLNSSILNFNYGDQFRGEVILDQNENILVTSTTKSSDFPVIQGPQNSLSGAQDAVVFKLNPSLSSLIWSGYFGGLGVESGNSIQSSINGDIYFVGGTNSSSLSYSSGFDLSFNGGISDGYITRLNGNTGAILSGTFLGLNEYDQSYCVQLDLDDKVYVLGQTESNWQITPGLYGVANSGQFIQKLSSNLNSIEWTTMIGAGSGHVEISPTAFLVSDCYDIYLSGWGGTTNSTGGQAINSTSNGFPVTIDAYQPTTNGSNFYIAVLAPDANYLKYGTYMGGVSGPANHVDGGTSRFDKDGTIYHAVCASCGAMTNGFPTTPGAWSNIAPSNNCNLAAFKFELGTIQAAVADPNPVICLPDSVYFNNNSVNGNAFLWDFGDNTLSTEMSPSHLYPGPGQYNVTMIAADTNNCYVSDTVFFEVIIGDFIGGVVTPPSPICPGDTFEFEAYGGAFYDWSPSIFLSDSTIYNPLAIIDQTTDFMVIISDTCGIDTVLVTLEVYIDSNTISNDTSICIGNSVDLFATGGISYSWSPITSMINQNTSTPSVTPLVTTLYNVEIETLNGCFLEDSVLVEVNDTPPIPIIDDSVSVCIGDTIEIEVSGAESYSWSPNINIDTIYGPNVVISPINDIYYYCDFTNSCGTVRDSILIIVVEPSITAWNDTIICLGETANLSATGAESYLWSPSTSLNSSYLPQVLASPSSPTMYFVIGTDQFGCTSYDSVFVDLFPVPFIQTNPDVQAFYGDDIQLYATSTTSGDYIWSPSEYLSCVVCDNPIANPEQNFFYVVSYTDENGCSASDSVYIYYNPVIYVPNTFTPDSDEFNSLFLSIGGNINTFEMLVFDRWGELVFESLDINIGWDGTYKGQNCQDGTYVWKINLTDFNGKEYNYVGHINLVR